MLNSVSNWMSNATNSHDLRTWHILLDIWYSAQWLLNSPQGATKVVVLLSGTWLKYIRTSKSLHLLFQRTVGFKKQIPETMYCRTLWKCIQTREFSNDLFKGNMGFKILVTPCTRITSVLLITYYISVILLFCCYSTLYYIVSDTSTVSQVTSWRGLLFRS